jgi:hypothetical protein
MKDWRDEIDTKSHSFFFIYKILNGCNGLRPAYLYEFVQPCLTRKPGHNLRNENNTFHLPFSSTIMIILFLSLLDYAILIEGQKTQSYSKIMKFIGVPSLIEIYYSISKDIKAWIFCSM